MIVKLCEGATINITMEREEIKELFGGKYSLIIDDWLHGLHVRILNSSERLVTSITPSGSSFWYEEIGSHHLLVGSGPNSHDLLINLEDLSTRILSNVDVYLYKALLSPNERILLIIGENDMNELVYSFHDLYSLNPKQLETPELEFHLPRDPTDDCYDESRHPLIRAHTMVEWQPDNRLIWKEKRPYHIDLQMWQDDARKFIDEKELEWRVYKTIILKHEGNKMVVV